jgi:hypothetical protein
MEKGMEKGMLLCLLRALRVSVAMNWGLCWRRPNPPPVFGLKRFGAQA